MTSSQDSPQNSSQDTPLPAADIEGMSNLLLGLVRSLVDQPGNLHLETESGDTGLTFRLYVAADDLGKVIGKQGRTARAIRTLLSAIASKSNRKFSLDVLESE